MDVTMPVRAVLAGAGLLAAYATPLSAQGALAIRSETIAPGYVVISGYTNGNILAVLGVDGVLLVDAQSARRVPQADSALRTFTDQPVRWVINTHYHADHIQGNTYWRARGAEILAHERVVEEARKDTTIVETGWHRAPADPDGLPTRTFGDSLVLRLPLGNVIARHAPAAHTSGDAIVWFPAADIVHMGDILELGAPPFVDRWAGGTIDGMIRAADAVLARASDRTRIVPGHGPVTDRAGLAAYRDMLATIRDRMHDQIGAGRTREQLAVGEIIAGFAEPLGGDRRARQFVEQLYHGLGRQSRGPAPLSAGAFIVRLGTDTIAVERFERYPDRLDGMLVRRTGTPVVHDYTVSLDPAGRPTRFDDSLSRRAGPSPARGLSTSVVFGSDSATVTVTRDTAVTRRVAAAEPAFPTLPESFALYELWLWAAGNGGTPVTLVAPLGGPAGRLTPRRGAGDTVRIPIFGGDLVARVDEAGRLLALDGRATTLKYQVERVPDLYLEPLAANFAVRDSVGRGLGTWLSGRDTVVGTVGPARIWIDYGRPARRGREVFTHGVLGDTLWRTGANAATQLETSAPLELGGVTLPAGRYSLWTHFGASVAELIVNGQSGQWGTQHDPARDVLRVPLRAVPLEQPVEVFTIVLEGDGGSTVLGLRWDRTELQVVLRPPRSP
jgi:glyoxylase-like metal-dependent hydrolase (beta-lactamase superfamily II)